MMKVVNGSLKQMLLTACLLWTCLLSVCVFAANTKIPLPLDQAFAFSVTTTDSQHVQAKWRIAPGYYLYANKLHITFTPTTTAAMQLPHSENISDVRRGNVQVFAGDLRIPIHLQSNATQLQMHVEYQGCSQQGFCYPPTHKTVLLNLASPAVVQSHQEAERVQHSLTAILINQNVVQTMVNTYHPVLTLFMFIGIGLLLAFTPCVLPMVPIVTAIIVGQRRVVRRKKAFFLALTYVFGMALTYALAGLAAASFGSSVQVLLQKPSIIIFVALLFVLLALALFGVYDLRLSQRLQNRIAKWSSKHEGGTFLGVLMMGVISTLVVSPCVTAPLVGVLLYISQTGDLLFGATSLFAIALGMGIPLILVAMSASVLLPKSGAWMRVVQEIFAMFMLAMAIWMLSRIISQGMVMILFGALVIGSAALLAFSLPRHVGRRKLNRSLGGVTAAIGVVIMLVGMGVPSLINELLAVDNMAVTTTNKMTVVHNQDELNQQLALAKSAKRPVIVDFYADWCESCKMVEQKVFQSPRVQTELQDFVVLRADLSAVTPATEALMKNYDVIAPPTILFFTDAAQVVNSRRIVGEVDDNEFLAFLNLFIEASCTKNVQC